MVTFVALLAGLVGIAVFASREHFQRLRADEKTLETSRLAYRASIAAAAAAIHENDLPTAWENLNAAPPEFRGWEWEYYHHLAHRERQSFSARRASPVAAFSASAGGTSVAVAYADGLVRVLDCTSGKTVGEWVGAGGTVKPSIALSAEGAMLAMMLSENVAGVIDLSNGHERWRTDDIACVGEFVPGKADVVLWARSSPTLRVIDAWTGQLKSSFSIPCSGVTQLRVSPDGELFAAVGGSHVTVGDLYTGSILHAFETWQWSFSADGRRIMTSGLGSRAMDSRTGNPIHVATAARPSSEAVFARPDGTVLAWVDPKNQVLFNEVSSDSRVGQLAVPSGVWSLAFTRDDSGLVTISTDATLAYWDANLTPDPFLIPQAKRDKVFAAAISPSADAMAVVDWGVVRLYDASTGALTWRRTVSRQYLQCAAFSADGSRIATAGKRGDLVVLDTQRGRVIQSIRLGAQYEPLSIVFRKRRKSIAIGCTDGTILEVPMNANEEVGGSTTAVSALRNADGRGSAGVMDAVSRRRGVDQA